MNINWQKLIFVAVLGCSMALPSNFAMVPPVNAKSLSMKQRWQRFKGRVKQSGTSARFTYAPPKAPVSVSCDRQGNMYGSVSPQVRTPAGSFGISVSRKFKKAKCR